MSGESVFVWCKDCVKGHCDDWAHLIAAVNSVAQRPDGRCGNCGGTIGPNLRGQIECATCGCLADPVDPTAGVRVTEPSPTLQEYLLQMRREAIKRTIAWVPTDDDVKVTVL